jgi:hypothetical protein
VKKLLFILILCKISSCADAYPVRVRKCTPGFVQVDIKIYARKTFSGGLKMSGKNTRKPFFEDTSVGKMKERIYNLSDREIDDLLAEYEIPSSGEIEKPGSYIQNTIRKELVDNRRKNDIVLIPIRSPALPRLSAEKLKKKVHLSIWPSPLTTEFILPGIRGCPALQW